MINEKLGKVTVIKTDAEGEAFGKKEARFKLEYPDGTFVEKETDSKGNVVFDNLPFGTYKLTETSTRAGYNKLAKTIEVTIPLKNENSDGNYFYFIGKGEDAGYYYPEITLTVENDQAFAMPATSGSGFFWPGIMGMAAAVGAAGYYAVYNKKKKRRRRLNN